MRVGSLEVAATRAQARPEAAPGVAVKPQRAHCNAGCALRNAGTARAAAAAVGCYIRTLLILDLTAAFPSTRRARFWGKSSMAVFFSNASMAGTPMAARLDFVLSSFLGIPLCACVPPVPKQTGPL